MPLDLPITYLLSAHIPEERRLQLEDEIPNLTYDITEAKLVLGKVATKQRAEFELRSRKLWTEEVKGTEEADKYAVKDQGNGGRRQEEGPARKKRRTGPSKIPDHVEVVVLDSSTESEAEEEESQKRSVRGRSGSSTQSEDVQSPAQSPRRVVTSSPPREESPHTPRSPTASQEGPEFNWSDTIKVVKLSWFEESMAVGHMLPLDGYIVYEGRRVEAPKHRNIMKVTLLAHMECQHNN
jgi:DNA polymerase IV